MPRIAFIAKPATSRTRRRTSIGSYRKAEEARITPICRSIALGLAIAAGSATAHASIPSPADPARAYVAARAASISGDHASAAEIYARLASGSADTDLKQKAISEAVSAGNMPLALRLVRQDPQLTTIDSKLLLVADELRRGQNANAVKLLTKGSAGADLSFWVPLVQAWDLAARRDPAAALALLARVPASSAFAPFVEEESALILLKAGKPVEADPYARRAIAKAGLRETRLRIAFAAGFAAANDRARAVDMIDGMSGDTTAIRGALDAGRLKSMMIDTAAEAYSEQLVALALEMARSDTAPPAAPVNIIQIARYAAPENSSATVLLGNLLLGRDRIDDALAALRSVDRNDVLRPEAMDAEARALINAKRYDQAIALVREATSRPGATADDFARLGDLYGAMKRYDEEAGAYAQALARLGNAGGARVWPLLLLRAGALESGGHWPEAKAALNDAIAIAPNEPLILNFLGYAKLEHGEDLDAAEAMIRKASELSPDDASITDSLGWALYKRGRLDEAIEVLQKAAIGDPAQADIQEHLGDALYAAGRRFEARFSWMAALVTADDDDTKRIRDKIDSGLTKATAAP